MSKNGGDASVATKKNPNFNPIDSNKTQITRVVAVLPRTSG